MANQIFKSTVALKEGLYCEGEVRGFKFAMDEPTQLGGTDKAMTPVEMLLSSLAGCLAITISAFSKAAHVDLKDVKVFTEGDLDPAGFLGTDKNARKGFSQIRFTIELVTDASEAKINKLMKMVEERCPVSDTLKGVDVLKHEVRITTNTSV